MLSTWPFSPHTQDMESAVPPQKNYCTMPPASASFPNRFINAKLTTKRKINL